MKKIITIAGAVLFAFCAIAAGTSDQPNRQLASVEYDGPVSTVKAVAAPAHDYQLERDSCCGPQRE